MDPNLHLAQQLEKMGFDLEQMESTRFHSQIPNLFKGSYIEIIPCKGVIRKYGDALHITFNVIHPIHSYAALQTIEVHLYETNSPFPVVSHRYEQGDYPHKRQIIENISQLAKAAAVQKIVTQPQTTRKTSVRKLPSRK